MIVLRPGVIPGALQIMSVGMGQSKSLLNMTLHREGVYFMQMF